MLQLQRFAQPDPLRRYSQDVPEELASIIAELLEKDPEKRIPSAMILARRLEAMEHGLTARREAQDSGDVSNTVADPGSGRVQIFAKSSSDSGSDDPLSVTKPDSGLGRASPRPGDSGELGETQYTGQGNPDGGYSLVEPATPVAVKATGAHFTMVEDETEAETSALRETLAILGSPHTWLLIGSLACLALIAIWLLRPPSADTLYDTVVALASDENPDRLFEAEDDIARFLQHYPQDERKQEIEGYRDDIELMKMERRFDRRAKQMKVDQSSAVVRAYMEAMQVAPFDPGQAATKLEALLALYGQADGKGAAERLPPDNSMLALQLARKELPRLREAAKEQLRDDLKDLKAQLANADKLHATQPARARAMWEGIIVLYEKKSWAQEVVDQARKRLAMDAAPEPQTARAGN
jgi:serine/threonine-protein kinase